MTDNPVEQRTPDHETPLNLFSQCHAGILSQLDALASLPALVEAAAQARSVAASTLAMFQHGIFEHHAEEEAELFPAVLRSAHPGAERDRVQDIVARLTSEHRTLEALWKRVEPALNATVKGKYAEVDVDVVAELVHAYGMHARFEEEEFLPLSDIILGRDGNHMAALGLALHMRHSQLPG
ncbi:MAG TPA: hemerythrin domain-containing protein [Ramlibacter sp.]|nr:hemerythrin domain-containing protein [Ramlibacter sp.]